VIINGVECTETIVATKCGSCGTTITKPVLNDFEEKYGIRVCPWCFQDPEADNSQNTNRVSSTNSTNSTNSFSKLLVELAVLVGVMGVGK